MSEAISQETVPIALEGEFEHVKIIDFHEIEGGESNGKNQTNERLDLIHAENHVLANLYVSGK